MNNPKLNVYKKVLQEIYEKFDGAKYFSNNITVELCNNENLSLEEVT